MYSYFSLSEPPLLTPWKKRKTENESSLCLVCQEKSTVKLIQTLNIESVRKLLWLTLAGVEHRDKVYELLKGKKPERKGGYIRTQSNLLHKCCNENIIV